MRFLPYPQDAAPTRGDDFVLDRVRTFEEKNPEDLDDEINTFIEALSNMPDYVPVIVKIDFVMPKDKKYAAQVHFRVIGPPTPPPPPPAIP